MSLEKFRMPEGNVKFKIGNIKDLPFNAEEIKLFMISGDPSIYIIPVSEIPASYVKVETKISGSSDPHFIDPLICPMGDFL